MSLIATDLEGFEQSEAWQQVKLALGDFADTYEVDEEVLITAVSEAIDSIINTEEF